MRRLTLSLLLLCGILPLDAQTPPVSLNGRWEAGDDRRYDRTAEVPRGKTTAAFGTAAK